MQYEIMVKQQHLENELLLEKSVRKHVVSILFTLSGKISRTIGCIIFCLVLSKNSNLFAEESEHLNQGLTEHPIFTGKIQKSGFFRYKVDNKIKPNIAPFFLPEDQLVQQYEGAWQDGKIILKELTWPVSEPATNIIGFCAAKNDSIHWLAQRDQIFFYKKELDTQRYDPATDNNPVVGAIEFAKGQVRKVMTLGIAEFAESWTFKGNHFQGKSKEGEPLTGVIELGKDGFIHRFDVSNAKGKWLRINYFNWCNTELGYYPKEVEFVEYSSSTDSKGRVAQAWRLDEVNLLAKTEQISIFEPARHVVLSSAKQFEWINGTAFLRSGTNIIKVIKKPETFEFTGSRGVFLLAVILCSVAPWLVALLKQRMRPFDQ